MKIHFQLATGFKRTKDFSRKLCTYELITSKIKSSASIDEVDCKRCLDKYNRACDRKLKKGGKL